VLVVVHVPLRCRVACITCLHKLCFVLQEGLLSTAATKHTHSAVCTLQPQVVAHLCLPDSLVSQINSMDDFETPSGRKRTHAYAAAELDGDGASSTHRVRLTLGA
jgi:hypothetical protein